MPNLGPYIVILTWSNYAKGDYVTKKFMFSKF